MLQQGGLVGRTVTSGADAASVAAEGADLVFIEVLPFLLPPQDLCHSVQLPTNHQKLLAYISLMKVRSYSLQPELDQHHVHLSCSCLDTR